MATLLIAAATALAVHLCWFTIARARFRARCRRVDERARATLRRFTEGLLDSAREGNLR